MTTYAWKSDEAVEKILHDIVKATPRARIIYIEPELFYRACMQIWYGPLMQYFVFQQREFRCKEGIS